MSADAIHDLQHDADTDAGPAGRGPALKDTPKPPPAPHDHAGPLPHEHAGPTPLGHATPLPPFDHDAKGAGGKLALTGVAALLAGVGAGFAIGRATAPRSRGLHLPFGGVRRRAAFGAVKLAPVVAYKTGRTAGRGTITLGRGARRAQRRATKATKAARRGRSAVQQRVS